MNSSVLVKLEIKISYKKIRILDTVSTAWKVSKYEVFFGPYFPTFGLNTERYMRENCPNTEFFLVHIFPHSSWIRRSTPYLFVFSPNVGKYGPEKTPNLVTFHAVLHLKILLKDLPWNLIFHRKHISVVQKRFRKLTKY